MDVFIVLFDSLDDLSAVLANLAGSAPSVVMRQVKSCCVA